MKTKLLAGLVLAAGTMFAGNRVSIGVQIGGGYGPGYYGYLPPPPPPQMYAIPRSPGRGFVWVGGYWYPNGRAYGWQPGYWQRPPRGQGRWNAPRYDRGRYYNGYWR
jgi:hypothetical protein